MTATTATIHKMKPMKIPMKMSYMCCQRNDAREMMLEHDDIRKGMSEI